MMISSDYRPQTKLRKGNVFTSVCHEFCPGGGVHLPGRHPLLGRHSTRQKTPRLTPPSRRSLQRTVPILLECILVLIEISVETIIMRESKKTSFKDYVNTIMSVYMGSPLSLSLEKAIGVQEMPTRASFFLFHGTVK